MRIHYRDYWDRPRVFVVPRSAHWILFDCPFSDELDDYPDRYSVGLIEPAPELLAEGADWSGVEQRVVRALGQIPVLEVVFTERDAIDAAVLGQVGLEPE